MMIRSSILSFIVICLTINLVTGVEFSQYSTGTDYGETLNISVSAGALGVKPILPPTVQVPVSHPIVPQSPDSHIADPLRYLPTFAEPRDNRSEEESPVIQSPEHGEVSTLYTGTEYIPGQILVKFRTNMIHSGSTADSQIASIHQDMGTTVAQDYSAAGLPGLQLVRLSTIPVPEAINRYQKNPLVEYAEPDYILHILDDTIPSPAPKPSSSTTSGVIIARPSIPDIQIPSRTLALHQPPIVSTSPDILLGPDRSGITAPRPTVTLFGLGNETEPFSAPVSSSFAAYTNKGEAGTVLDGNQSGGYIPAPVNFTHLKGKKLASGTNAYSSSFDLRDQQKVSPIRNQGACGSCWAHGTYGSLESVMLPTVRDFSENNLKNTHGFDWGPCDGGNNYISTAYLARWSGPVNESADPYQPNTNPSPVGLAPGGHVQDVILIPQRGGPLDNENIKWALTTHGGISAAYYHDDTAYSSAHAAFYNPSYAYSNHIITIVGWDDNFPASRFLTRPAGNGAFLCKNSWGTGWGQSGYFWISYYDTVLGYDELFTFLTASPVTNYARIYQYDPYGWVYSIGWDSPTAYLANVFTASHSEELTGVGFYTPDTGTYYEIEIYTGVTSGPLTGTRRQTVSGSVSAPGYHTVSIPAVSLTAGQKFSVVIRITTTGYGYPIAIEYPLSGYSSGASGSAGQSYISRYGSSYTDITQYYANTNVCIKAYTSASGSPPPTQTVTSTSTPTPTPTPTPTATATMTPGQDRMPNDPFFSNLWGMHNTGQTGGKADADIDAPSAWTLNTGSASTIIAVIDTGVDYNHPDLSANMWINTGEIAGNGIDDDRNGYIDDVRGWNFVSNNNNPMDDHSHGTHCAGTAAAVGNNGVGVAGVSWTAKIMPLKFLDSSGSGSTSAAVSAILYANRMGAHVLSNSWGGGGYLQSLKDAIDASPGVVVCASGNSGLNTDSSPQYPSAYTSTTIIAVAATDHNDNLASFSNYGGTSVDVGAPGVNIYSTVLSGGYGTKSGTSMATPHVAGLAGLIKSVNPTLTNLQIKSAIMNTVDLKSSLSGKCVTGGRINADTAVRSVYVPPLTAKFYGVPGTTVFPLTIDFKDASVGNPGSWSWNFGDGTTSAEKNPSHTYHTPGVYQVTLTINS